MTPFAPDPSTAAGRVLARVQAVADPRAVVEAYGSSVYVPDHASDVDVLVSPTSPFTPWKIGEKVDDPLAMYLSDLCTLPTNLAGHCAMSVPSGLSADDGLPVGLQILNSSYAGQYRPLVLAGAVFATVPIMVFYIIFRK
jgi:Asp-tRNA(Asn)/Glu-tRNA(Gln) amidotransferase A subunit family amidase